MITRLARYIIYMLTDTQPQKAKGTAKTGCRGKHLLHANGQEPLGPLTHSRWSWTIQWALCDLKSDQQRKVREWGKVKWGWQIVKQLHTREPKLLAKAFDQPPGWEDPVSHSPWHLPVYDFWPAELWENRHVLFWQSVFWRKKNSQSPWAVICDCSSKKELQWKPDGRSVRDRCWEVLAPQRTCNTWTKTERANCIMSQEVEVRGNGWKGLSYQAVKHDHAHKSSKEYMKNPSSLSNQGRDLDSSACLWAPRRWPGC